MTDDHASLLGKIENQIENLIERQERHYEANREDHLAIRADLTAQKAGLAVHNDKVLTCIATTSAEKASADSARSRIWSVIYFAVALCVAGLGTLFAFHLKG